MKHCNRQNRDSVFGTNFSQRIVFNTYPGIYRRFRPKVLSQTPKKAVFFTRGPNPKVLIMRWKRSPPPKHPVFQGYVENPLHQSSSERVPLEILSIYSSRKRKHRDGQVDRQVFTSSEALQRCLVGHVTAVHHERGAKTKTKILLT